MCIPSLAKTHLGPMQAGRGMHGDLFGHRINALFRAMQARNGGQLFMHRTPEQIEHTGTQNLALEIPQRNVDPRYGHRSKPRPGAIPPAMFLELQPDRLILQRIRPHHQCAKPFHQLGGRQCRLGKIGATFAPAHMPVFTGNANQTHRARAVVISGFTIADRQRLDFHNPRHVNDPPCKSASVGQARQFQAQPHRRA